jgi:uncharacterized protein (TIGR02145 family)
MQPTLGGWNPPNTGATNSSGFTALPGGLRHNNGEFSNVANFGDWWSSSVSSGSNALDRGLYSTNGGIGHFISSRTDGFSIRCLKD